MPETGRQKKYKYGRNKSMGSRDNARDVDCCPDE